MKRIIFYLTSLVLVFALPIGAFAAKSVTFSSESGEPGDTIIVSINVDNLLGVAGYNIDFTYDSSVLTATAADKGDDADGTFVPNILTAGEVRLGLINFQGSTSESAGNLAKVTFTIAGNAFKNGTLTFTKTDLKDENGASIADVTSTDGSVAVTGVTTTVTVIPASTTDVVAGQPVTLTAAVKVNDADLTLTSVDDISFAKSGNGTFGAKTLSSGKVEVAYTTHTTIETATITATENVTGNTNTGTASVTSVAGTLATLTVSPDTASLTADETQQFTVAGVDANDNTADIGTITWTVTGIGTIDSASGLFNATTVGTGSVTATSSVGSVADSSGTITVTAGAATAGASTVEATTPVVADGTATSTITVTAKDSDGNLVAGATVVLASTGTGNTITQPAAVSDASGVATGTMVSTKAESKTVSATIDSVTVTDTATVAFAAGAAAKIQLGSSASSFITNGTDTVQITGTVEDANGNTVTDYDADDVVFTLDGITLGTFSGAATATVAAGSISDGVATATLSALDVDLAGTVQISAASGALASYDPATPENSYIALAAINKVLDNIEITIVTGGLAESATPKVGETVQFKATGHYKIPGEAVDTDLDEDLTTIVTWSSSVQTVGTIGSSTGLFSPIAEGSSDVTAALGDITSNSVSVTVAPFAGTIALAADPATLVADGATTTALTATVQVASASILDGATVSFTVSTGTGTVTASGVTANGTATATYTSSTVAGTETVTATIGTGTASGTADVTLIAGAAAKIELGSSAGSFITNGTETVEITGTVEDANGNTVTDYDAADVVFALEFSGESTAAVGTASISNGVATATLSALDVDLAGTVQVSATSGALASYDPAIPENNYIVLEAINKVLDNIEVTIVTGGLAESATPKVGETVQFKATGHYKIPGEAVDTNLDEDLTTIVTWSSSVQTVGTIGASTGLFSPIAEGSSDVTAALGDITSNSVSVTVAPFAGTIALAADPATLVADGATTTALTATVQVGGANILDGATVSFAVSTGTGTVTASGVTANGTATATYTSSTVAGTETVTATIGTGTANGTANITLIAGAADKIKLESAASSFITSGSDTIQISGTVEDINGNTVLDYAADAVVFSLEFSGEATATVGTASISSGVATATLSALDVDQAGTVQVSATSGALTSYDPAIPENNYISLEAINRVLHSIELEIVTGGLVSTASPKVGETVQFKATGHYAVPGQAIEPEHDEDFATLATWSSSDETKGTIGVTGLFAAVAVGSTEVTASYEDITSSATTLDVQTAEAVVFDTGDLPDTLAVDETIDFGAITSGGTGAGFTYTIDSQPAGDPGIMTEDGKFSMDDDLGFAGVYTIMATDDNSGASTTFSFSVHFVVTPDALTFTETKYNGTANPQVFTVTGASTDYTWEIGELDDNSVFQAVETPTDFGTWTKTSPVTDDNTNTLNPADVTEIKKFYVRVTVENDMDLTAENGLNQRVVGLFSVVPLAAYTVTVEDSSGAVDGSALQAGDITVTEDITAQTNSLTAASGKVTFLLPDVGNTFLYEVTDTRAVPIYIDREVFDNAKTVTIELSKTSGETITGTVEDTTNNPLQDVEVTAYQLKNDGTPDFDKMYAMFSDVDGKYTINLPVDASQSEWTVVAALSGYVSGKLTGQAAGMPADFTGANGLQVKSEIVSVSATVVGATVQINITGIPAFAAAGDVTVTRVDATGTYVPTLSGETISVVHDAVEDFTVLIQTDTSSLTFRYIAEDKDLKTGQGEIDSNGGSVDLSDEGGQPAAVEVPAGGVKKEDVTIEMKQVPKDEESAKNEGSPSFVYEVTAIDNTTGEALSDDEINRIEITLPIDLTVIHPGDLENGTFVIYQAGSRVELGQPGGTTPVPADRIVRTDYIGDGTLGSVTFWVDHLSAFQIGTDDVPPVITMRGEDMVELILNANFPHNDVTATDDVDGDITGDIVVGGGLDTSRQGTYWVTYDVSDSAGNAATQVTRTVKVIGAFVDGGSRCFINSVSSNSEQEPYAVILALLAGSILVFLARYFVKASSDS